MSHQSEVEASSHRESQSATPAVATEQFNHNSKALHAAYGHDFLVEEEDVPDDMMNLLGKV